jgi:hypothetical protein
MWVALCEYRGGMGNLLMMAHAGSISHAGHAMTLASLARDTKATDPPAP